MRGVILSPYLSTATRMQRPQMVPFTYTERILQVTLTTETRTVLCTTIPHVTQPNTQKRKRIKSERIGLSRWKSPVTALSSPQGGPNFPRDRSVARAIRDHRKAWRRLVKCTAQPTWLGLEVAIKILRVAFARDCGRGSNRCLCQSESRLATYGIRPSHSISVWSRRRYRTYHRFERRSSDGRYRIHSKMFWAVNGF